MSDRAPDHPTPSPYLTWLLSLTPEERAWNNAEAEVLYIELHDLLMVIRRIQPDISAGVWLRALQALWQEMEQVLLDQLTHGTPAS